MKGGEKEEGIGQWKRGYSNGRNEEWRFGGQYREFQFVGGAGRCVQWGRGRRGRGGAGVGGVEKLRRLQEDVLSGVYPLKTLGLAVEQSVE